MFEKCFECKESLFLRPSYLVFLNIKMKEPQPVLICAECYAKKYTKTIPKETIVPATPRTKTFLESLMNYKVKRKKTIPAAKGDLIEQKELSTKLPPSSQLPPAKQEPPEAKGAIDSPLLPKSVGMLEDSNKVSDAPVQSGAPAEENNMQILADVQTFEFAKPKKKPFIKKVSDGFKVLFTKKRAPFDNKSAMSLGLSSSVPQNQTVSSSTSQTPPQSSDNHGTSEAPLSHEA